MHSAQMLALLDRYQRIELCERGYRREATPEAIRLVHEGQGEGTVLYSNLSAANADRVIEAQIAAFRALGQDFEWKVYGHDAPADLAQRLLDHGFIAEPAESVMVLELRQAPGALLAPVRHDVRRILDPAQLAAIGAIHACVWPEDAPDSVGRTQAYLELLADSLRHDPEHTSIYVAYAAERPVSYARVTFQDGDPFAGLWGGSTLAEHRGQGFYTALLATRLQEAMRRGMRFLTLDASPMSRPIVEKQGFRCLTHTQPFHWHLHP